jgi:cyclase
MLRSRIIPCLLIHKGGLVKTQKFSNPIYLGDPINAVRIFNEKEADELIVFDIDATVNGVEPNFDFIAKLAAECRMPLCYGGGVNSLDQAIRLVNIGVEKIAISYAGIINPSFLTELASAIGSQSVVAVLDVRKQKGLFSNYYEVCSHNSKNIYKNDFFDLVLQLQDAGAGEIVINSIDNDGMMQGYDLNLAMQIKATLRVPLTFLGGAGSLDHLSELIRSTGLVGAAAGSLFVFKGKYRAVLINYPTSSQKNMICRGT